MNRHFPKMMLLLFLGGCQTATALPALKQTAKVTVVSFPAGAVIDVNGNYMGRTPNVIELQEYRLEKEKDVAPYQLFLHPQEETYCTKNAVLDPYDLPARIAFDLTQCQGEPSAH